MEDVITQHAVFRNDPLKLRGFVKKYVEISKTNGLVSKGTVFTIDPVSESVFLLTKTDGKLSAELVLGHAVCEIKLVDQPLDYEPIDDSIFGQKDMTYSPKALEARKSKVKTWLNNNRLPITESGDVLVMENVVTIYPPYNLENIVSSNEMVLERIQNLMRNLPETQ